MDDNFTTVNTINFNNYDSVRSENDRFLLGKTGFQFVDDHMGFRPGKLHVILARTSLGKTSLMRALFKKMSYEHKCLWYASEETFNDWMVKFNKNDLPRQENCFFENEFDLKKILLNKNDFIDHLAIRILEKQIKFFVFDNITTSHFYNDKQSKEQSDFLSDFKEKIIQKTNVAAVLVAHVSASCKKKSPRSEDVRGNKTISNLAEYWYNLGRNVIDIEGSEKIITTVHVEKSRGQGACEIVYQLQFDKDYGYTRDKKINWSEYNRLCKEDLIK